MQFMELSTILNSDAVRVFSTVSSKKRLFQDVGDMAGAIYGVEPARAVEALQDRESLGPTGVGQGVALPHARLPGLDSVRGVFVRLEKAIDFDAVDRKPVDLVFTLFAPEDAGVDHLKALALVSRRMRNGALCAKLRANTDPGTLHAMLTEMAATQAA